MIVSRQNQRIKSIRRLRSCKGEFAFLEGPHLVEEASAAGIEFKHLVATDEFLSGPSGRKLEPELPEAPLIVSAPVLQSLADSSTPRGIIAVAKMPRAGVGSLPRSDAASYLYLERIQDPGNLGAIARSAEATGVAGIGLSLGCAHPNHPRALRASAGSLLRVPIAVGVTLEDLLDHLGGLTPIVVGLDAHGGENLYQADFFPSSPSGCLILVVGSEGTGLGAETRSLTGHLVRIPLEAPVESLNATVAASVVLHELARRRALRGKEES